MYASLTLMNHCCLAYHQSPSVSNSIADKIGLRDRAGREEDCASLFILVLLFHNTESWNRHAIQICKELETNLLMNVLCSKNSNM